ncbi:hypothetical protein BTJ49_14795 [Oleiagrimonas sp. MCCC 1A03011]|nr:hypothetical protein BTJ49_14795 [Oleiagrimonas sp. MCCC 1A03011]
MLLLAGTVHADDFTVYSPHVIATQSEFELRGYHLGDGRANYHGGQAAEFSVAHAFTGWWKPELYLARYERAPGERSQWLGYEFENVFQLTEPGRYWADVGVLASYEHNTAGHGPDALEAGALIEKTQGRFDHIVNLIWEKHIGAGASRRYEFRYSYRGTYAVSSAFRPGIEAYGRPADHAYQAGPIVAGEWHVPDSTSNIEYRVGVLFGVNTAAPQHTWLAQVEYEFF